MPKRASSSPRAKSKWTWHKASEVAAVPEFICPSRACADLERARLLHQYALDRSSADAQRLADLQYARAALVEAQDTLFQLGPAHAPALFICASFAVLLIAAA